MKEFLQTHSVDILSIFFIVLFFAISYGFVNLVSGFFIRRAKKKHPGENPHNLILIRTILRIMLFLSTGTALVVLFLGEKHRDLVSENSEMLWYIGLVIVICILVASRIESYFLKKIKEETESEDGDATGYRFLRYLAVFGVYFVAAMMIILAFPSLRGIAQAALGGAGVLAIVAGLAMQETFANIIGGIFIVTFKPFKINDVIKVSDDLIGTVTDITLRHTVIKNFENKMIIIPNNSMNKDKVINFDLADKRICQWIEVGISYDSDVDLALKILQEKCEAHPLVIDTRDEEALANGIPKVVVRVVKLDNSSINLKAWAWVANFGDGFQAKCDLFYQIKKAFDANGIEIPFPHRTLVFKENQLTELAKRNSEKK